MKSRSFKCIWSVVILDTIKTFSFSSKSIFLAEMLLRSTLAELCYSSPTLPNETSYITKTHCYSNGHLYGEIRQAQPKFHQKLTHLSVRALSVSKSESMKLAGTRGISFPSSHILPLHRPDGWEVKRQGMLSSQLAVRAVRQWIKYFAAIYTGRMCLAKKLTTITWTSALTIKPPFFLCQFRNQKCLF